MASRTPLDHATNLPRVVPALRKIRPAVTASSDVDPARADGTKAAGLRLPLGKPDFPDFPPPDVALHKDDASNKVFLAIGRSFLSVDNCAMTIKDLSEMTMRFGLMCQNVSAAGQAITTFIRNHMQRCEREQDHPLLSRHILSGTPSDDDLVPALHSRSGGAHCALPPGNNRITNFRRGTMVWYLSRAAGAPCPFARAGIHLAEYSEDGKVGCPVVVGPRERKRERDRRRRLLVAQQLCGQKRKRLARGCKPDATGTLDDDDDVSAAPAYDDDYDGTIESEADARPPKVKLTLRLRPSFTASSMSLCASSAQPTPTPSPPPLIEIPMDEDEEDSEDSESSSDSDSDSDSESDSDMSVDSETGECDSSADLTFAPPPSAFFRMPSPSSFARNYHEHHHHLRRSPSVASLPPDSEDDEDDLADRFRLDFDDEDDLDWSSEDEAEEEGEGHRAGEETIVVKQEPVDEDAIGGLLHAWDTRDRGVESQRVLQRVLEVVTAAASLSNNLSLSSPPSSSIAIKREELDDWDLAERAPVEDSIEEAILSPVEEHDLLLDSPTSVASASYEPRGRRASELLWQDTEILGLETITPGELDEGDWFARPSLVPEEAAAAPSPEAESEGPCTPSSSLPSSMTVPQVWSGSSPFRFGDRDFDAPTRKMAAVPTAAVTGSVSNSVSESAYSDGDFDHATAGADDEDDEGASLALWDMDELRRCVPSVPPPTAPVEEPLSPTEEAMFHALCDVRDFEPPRREGGADDVESMPGTNADVEEVERPLALRRSKRVQAQRKLAVATTASGRRGRRKVVGQ